KSELDTFNSSDPKKLCTFLVQCELNFQDRPHACMVLQWFEPDLLSDSNPNNCPLWMDNWREFIIELQTTFGPHDLVANAEHELDHLQMKDNQCINKYVVEFNCIALQLQGYRDGALCHHFYKLCLLAQEVDAHYWEHKEEIQCQTKNITSTSKQANSGNNSTQDSG
ncbi:hypothetical protein ID866_10857, partial [Astraeus odoratus]